MNHREFGVCRDPRPQWFYDAHQLAKLWENISLLFMAGRVGPTVVYVYSIVFWWDDLRQLTPAESRTYHSMALFFTLLNHYLSMYLTAWKQSDHKVRQELLDARDEEAGKRQG